MRVPRIIAGTVLLGFVALAPARAQATHPTILIDGHVGVDTTLGMQLARQVRTNLIGLLKGTGVSVSTMFAPEADQTQPFKGELSEVVAAAKRQGADIAIEMNVLQGQNGNITSVPLILVGSGEPVEMAPASGQSVEAIARSIAARIAKDTVRLRRLAERP